MSTFCSSRKLFSVRHINNYHIYRLNTSKDNKVPSLVKPAKHDALLFNFTITTSSGLPLRFPIFPNSEKGKIYFNEFPKLGNKISMDFLFFLKIGRALFN